MFCAITGIRGTDDETTLSNDDDDFEEIIVKINSHRATFFV